MFSFSNQTSFYQGKVRDVYGIKDKLLMIASNRISAFDVVLPQPIPYKGQVLTQISAFFLEKTREIVPNWLEQSPTPHATFGKKCEMLPVEMVIRGYLVGSAWRAYKAGQRIFNGVELPNDLKENGILPFPIITPTTKAEKGQHDEDITGIEIIEKGIISKEIYAKMKEYTFQLFQFGQKWVAEKGLILADTKYEFGLYNGEVYLIDEIHTPDSARYFDIKNYEESLKNNTAPTQKSKEMVRQWLIKNGFQGQTGQKIPIMSYEWIEAISNEYISLYEQITGKSFVKYEIQNEDLENFVNNYV